MSTLLESSTPTFLDAAGRLTPATLRHVITHDTTPMRPLDVSTVTAIFDQTRHPLHAQNRDAQVNALVGAMTRDTMELLYGETSLDFDYIVKNLPTLTAYRICIGEFWAHAVGMRTLFDSLNLKWSRRQVETNDTFIGPQYGEYLSPSYRYTLPMAVTRLMANQAIVDASGEAFSALPDPF